MAINKPLGMTLIGVKSTNSAPPGQSVGITVPTQSAEQKLLAEQIKLTDKSIKGLLKPTPFGAIDEMWKAAVKSAVLTTTDGWFKFADAIEEYNSLADSVGVSRLLDDFLDFPSISLSEGLSAEHKHALAQRIRRAMSLDRAGRDARNAAGRAEAIELAKAKAKLLADAEHKEEPVSQDQMVAAGCSLDGDILGAALRLDAPRGKQTYAGKVGGHQPTAKPGSAGSETSPQSDDSWLKRAKPKQAERGPEAKVSGGSGVKPTSSTVLKQKTPSRPDSAGESRKKRKRANKNKPTAAGTQAKKPVAASVPPKLPEDVKEVTNGLAVLFSLCQYFVAQNMMNCWMPEDFSDPKNVNTFVGRGNKFAWMPKVAWYALYGSKMEAERINPDLKHTDLVAKCHSELMRYFTRYFAIMRKFSRDGLIAIQKVRNTAPLDWLVTRITDSVADRDIGFQFNTTLPSGADWEEVVSEAWVLAENPMIFYMADALNVHAWDERSSQTYATLTAIFPAIKWKEEARDEWIPDIKRELARLSDRTCEVGNCYLFPHIGPECALPEWQAHKTAEYYMRLIEHREKVDPVFQEARVLFMHYSYEAHHFGDERDKMLDELTARSEADQTFSTRMGIPWSNKTASLTAASLSAQRSAEAKTPTTSRMDTDSVKVPEKIDLTVSDTDSPAGMDTSADTQMSGAQRGALTTPAGVTLGGDSGGSATAPAVAVALAGLGSHAVVLEAEAHTAASAAAVETASSNSSSSSSSS
jgi:hypothetical protein